MVFLLTFSKRERRPIKVGKSRRLPTDQIENEWQKEGWLADTTEHGAIQAHAMSNTEKSGNTWIADVIWGFAEVDGLRRHTRKVHFIGPKGEEINARLVYDYRTSLVSSVNFTAHILLQRDQTPENN